jgi:hypothetical protein
MSERLLFMPNSGDRYEPVSAVEVKLEPARMWVLVRILRTGPEHESLWALPSQLHLEGSTFFGFVDLLRTLPGWREEYETYMLAGIVRAKGRAAAVGTSAEAGALGDGFPGAGDRPARSRAGATRSNLGGRA